MMTQSMEEFRAVCDGKYDTFHDLKDFGSFPWQQLDDHWLERVGGIGLNTHHKPVITFNRENGSMDRWEVPEQLKRLVDSYMYKGGKDAQLAMRDALGL